MEKKKVALYILRIVLTTALVLFTAWIFSNSLKVAQDSAAQSQGVTEKVQEVAQVVAPGSFAATAQGEDFKLLDAYVRTAAHFLEFMCLGVLSYWTYCAYTQKKRWMFIPFVTSVLTGLVDEILQIFSNGRAFEFADLLVDWSGALLGCGFGLLTALFGTWIARKITVRRMDRTQGET